MAWVPGRQIVRREIWRGRPWLAVVAIVVADTDELLASYIPSGSPFAFPPSEDGRPHPWLGRTHWEGNGVLMLQRPGEAYAVWHFWEGAERAFSGWYLNLQEPFRRSAIGYDTQDLELDIWVTLEGDWQFKDEELLELRVSDGRHTPEQSARIRALGGEIGAMLDRGERWWDDAWAAFTPEPPSGVPSFPEGWEDAGGPVATEPRRARSATCLKSGRCVPRRRTGGKQLRGGSLVPPVCLPCLRFESWFDRPHAHLRRTVLPRDQERR